MQSVARIEFKSSIKKFELWLVRSTRFLVTFWVKPRHLSIAKKFIELTAPTPVHEEAKIPCTAALSPARFCSILSALDYKPFLCSVLCLLLKELPMVRQRKAHRIFVNESNGV